MQMLEKYIETGGDTAWTSKTIMSETLLNPSLCCHFSTTRVRWFTVVVICAYGIEKIEKTHFFNVPPRHSMQYIPRHRYVIIIHRDFSRRFNPKISGLKIIIKIIF